MPNDSLKVCKTCLWWLPSDDGKEGVCAPISGNVKQGSPRIGLASIVKAGEDVDIVALEAIASIAVEGVLHTPPGFGCNGWTSKSVD